MTAYEQKLAELGITNRGRLAEGFAEDMPPSVKAVKQARHLGRDPKPPVVMEDLTHLQTGHAGGEKLRRQWLQREAEARARKAGWKKGEGKAVRV